MGDDGKQDEKKVLHIAICPWFAFGHLIADLHLANKLAAKGHIVSFFLPAKTQSKLACHNHHPDLITLIPITVPAVDGLPAGTETTADVSSGMSLIMTAMDLAQPVFDDHLARLRPDFVFFDFTHWMPGLAHKHGAKSVYYVSCQVSFFAFKFLLARGKSDGTDMSRALPGIIPNSSIRLLAHEVRKLEEIGKKRLGNDGLTLTEKAMVSIRDCDVVCFRSCREMEGAYGEFFEEKYGKRIVWVGPLVPEPPSSALDKELDGWLNGFEAGSVVYCALGSECVLAKDQFQELVLGLELTGLPFLAALKPPIGHEDIESALPQGFLERTRGKGIVGGWVQQVLILKYPSVGCFVTHCGSGSLYDALMSECQMVLLPHKGDQFINARFLSGDLRVGVEVDKGEYDGFFTAKAVCKAIMMTMDVESEIGKEIKANHAKWREFLLRDGFEDSYITSFIESLQNLLK